MRERRPHPRSGDARDFASCEIATWRIFALAIPWLRENLDTPPEHPADHYPRCLDAEGSFVLILHRRRALIKSLKLTNFLSFGPSSEAVELGPLNVLIGPNGSGKSNFLAAIDLLKNAPSHIEKPVRASGGVKEWLWKGSNVREGARPAATLTARVEVGSSIGGGMHIMNELIHDQGDVAYNYLEEMVAEKKINTTLSILAQWRGPSYPEIHSFDILARLNPKKVMIASPWAKRFIDTLKCAMQEKATA